MSMQKAVELRQQRASLVEEAKQILARAEKESRELTGDEEARWQEAMNDIDSLKEKIDRIERTEQLDAEMREVEARNREERVDLAKVEYTNEAYGRAFDKFVRYGIDRLNAEERALLEKRAQSTTDSAGGYTIPTSFAGFVTEAMKAFGGMRQSRATVLSTDSGNDLPFPTNDDTGNVGAILAENATATEQDLTFGEVVLGAWKYTSKLVRVSEELLQDSAVNMDEFLGRKLGERVGRILNTHFTVGDGSSKPRGLFTALSTGVTAASATAVTGDELIQLVYSIDPSYLAGAEWMFSHSSASKVRQIKTGSGDYLWQPGLTAGSPDRLLGYPVIINQDAPAMTTGLDAFAFGDFSYYYVRDVRGVSIKRFVERYGDALQVGFLAWSRHDGDWIDAGGGAAKVLTMG